MFTKISLIPSECNSIYKELNYMTEKRKVFNEKSLHDTRLWVCLSESAQNELDCLCKQRVQFVGFTQLKIQLCVFN